LTQYAYEFNHEQDEHGGRLFLILTPAFIVQLALFGLVASGWLLRAGCFGLVASGSMYSPMHLSQKRYGRASRIDV
jgi:hypothetical protein